MAAALELTDPTYDPSRPKSALDRFFLRYIQDERDLPFVYLMASASLVLFPFAIALYLPGVFTWWLAAIYFAVNLAVFFDRFILMLHNTSHRRLFKRRYDWMNRYIPWVLGPFFGETPETYFVHHIGMHHPENNLEDDVSSTMAYRRDSVVDFLRYWARFFFAGMFELVGYCLSKNRRKLARRALLGELSWYVVVVGLCFVSLEATLVVFIAPFVTARFLMMAGNWGQHAFVDADEPENWFKNSITCINTRYNRRCFNDGYHISHHEKATRHWTEHPDDLLAKREQYAAEDAILFEGIDFFQVWAFLMAGAYGKLADRFVDLRDEPRSRDEIIALLKSRVHPIRRAA